MCRNHHKLLSIVRRLFVFSLLLLPEFVCAQMSGIYTIGGSEPDFTTLNDALETVKNTGTTGNVELKMRNGIYEETIDLSWFEPEHTVTVQSESQIADSVRLTSESNYSEFHTSNNLVLDAITFEVNSGVRFTYCENISIRNCRFETDSTDSPIFTLLRSNFTNEAFNLENNFFEYGKVDISSSTGTVSGNHFGGRSNFTGIDLIYDNHFAGTSFLPRDCEVYDNYFAQSITGDHGIQFHHNYVGGNLSTGSVDFPRINANVIKGYLSVSGTNIYVTNNHLHKGLNVGYVDNGQLRIHHNNFKDSAYCRVIYYETAKIYNNNFNESISFSFGAPLDASNIKNNNYYPGYGFYGDNPTHFNPDYLSEDSLLATNPLLIGKGTFAPPAIYDMQGQDRPTEATIGANEFCLQADTVWINCGDQLQLRLCTFADADSIVWFPDELNSSETPTRPVVAPDVTTTYYAQHPFTGLSDSVVVAVLPFVLDIAEDVEVRCGLYGKLYEVPHPMQDVTISWSPIDSVIAYGNYTWFANPSQTTTYTMTLTHDYCGTFSDSVTVTINPIPLANGYIESQEENVVTFQDVSSCADSIRWYFGDGSSSSLENPVHLYEATGTYDISLVAFNEIATDTLTGTVYISSLPVSMVEEQEKEFKLYPNPTTGKFAVEIKNSEKVMEVKVTDFFGTEIYSKRLPHQFSSIEYFDITGKPAGVYFVQIKTANAVLVKKLIVE